MIPREIFTKIRNLAIETVINGTESIKEASTRVGEYNGLEPKQVAQLERETTKELRKIKENARIFRFDCQISRNSNPYSLQKATMFLERAQMAGCPAELVKRTYDAINKTDVTLSEADALVVAVWERRYISPLFTITFRSPEGIKTEKHRDWKEVERLNSIGVLMSVQSEK